MQERFLVKYMRIDNCFAYVSDTWLCRQGTKSNVITVSHKGATYFLSCSPKHNTDGTLCLSTTFAKALNIEEGDEVFVRSVQDVPSLTSITVVPRTTEDREILELQVNKVQSTLLNKIHIVAKDQPMVVWVSKLSTIILTTETLEPNFSYGKLEQFTEVRVTDAIENKDNEQVDFNEQDNGSGLNLRGALKKMIPTSTENRNNEEHKAHKNHALLQSYRRKRKSSVYRVHFLPKFDLPDASNPFDIKLSSPYHVFVPRRHVPSDVRFVNGGVICKIKKIPEDQQNTNVQSTNFLKNVESIIPRVSSELTVKLFILEDVLDYCSNNVDKTDFKLDFLHSNIYVSESVKIGLRLKMGGKVILTTIDVHEGSIPLTIEIFTTSSTTLPQTFKDFVTTYSARDKLLLNSYAHIKLNNDDLCIVKFLPEKCTYSFLDGTSLKNTTIHCKSKLAIDDLSELENEVDVSFDKISTRYLQAVLSECQITLDLSLRLNSPASLKYDRENILICGEVGSGKSTMCKMLIKRLEKSPYFVHTHMIDCVSLKGKKVEMLQRIVCTALSQCIYHQPSVLFLEDIESITMVASDDEENTPDSVNAARITDMIINTVRQCQTSHYVSIIATCVSVNKIGQKMRPARGSHFFKTVLSIPNLEKADRIDILQLMLEDKLYVPGNVNWDYYGNKTEGWMAQDLVDVADKATFAAWKRCAKEGTKPPIVITEDDISSVLKIYKPLSMQGVQLYKGSDHKWSDIGGLVKVKESLTEILHWPLKYPEIFKNAPIKLQSGVLLYGMPGTGKTLLAKAIANECGVNLISVKGPELLSKYIGVSEESVRNIFERAHRAKPCVLFFDEFDSLAPRRGHDSTGVTDRVVNQLLTQLDGIEDREGVAIVAATSRPDLLDPALLRPGRLDKLLYCSLPNPAEREEILQVLCKSQNIDITELDLKEIARTSVGLTGADLNAIITQAKLAAFEDAARIIPEEQLRPEDIKVSQEHLVESAKSIQPSLSTSEMAKYARIYSRFSKGDTFVEDMLRNQKATLA